MRLSARRKAESPVVEAWKKLEKVKREEVEREAAERRNETRLVEAREKAEAEVTALQKAVEEAIAARRGPRLEAAMGVIAHPIFARLIGSEVCTYLDACQTREKEEINKQRRIIGRAFVKPALQALEQGQHAHALRQAAAGALLARDPRFELVPELWDLALRAIFGGRTRAVLTGHTGGVRSASFSSDGSRIVTASDDTTVRLWDAATPPSRCGPA